MSSDSEDDCYGNIALKLQSMKNNYIKDKFETTNLLLADLKEKTDNSWRKNDSLTSEKPGNVCDVSQNSETTEDFSLDEIIAKNSKKRTTRAPSKRPLDLCLEKATKKKRMKKTDASTSQAVTNQPDDAETSVNTTIQLNNINGATSNGNSNNIEGSQERGRGSGRGRGRGRQSTPRRGRCRRQVTIPALLTTNLNESEGTQARGNRRRGRRSYWASQENSPLLYDFMAALAASAAMARGYTNPDDPIYSVGNTDEYPDQCESQLLFNTAPKNSDVVVVDDGMELDENEELSVKVYWQSSEHVRFNIRRFQKLTQIFDHFAERKNVSHDKLFFTYNDKILKSDDTPDSINYSIVKFIDGGIINQTVPSIFKKGSKEDGIQLKFQCQNVKKPFVLNIRPDEKMLVVMMKCSEHLEKTLDKLKFHFDGDLISGKNTPRELDLEGGECIDVKIVS